VSWNLPIFQSTRCAGMRSDGPMEFCPVPNFPPFIVSLETVFPARSSVGRLLPLRARPYKFAEQYMLKFGTRTHFHHVSVTSIRRAPTGWSLLSLFPAHPLLRIVSFNAAPLVFTHSTRPGFVCLPSRIPLSTPSTEANLFWCRSNSLPLSNSRPTMYSSPRVFLSSSPTDIEIRP